MLKVAFMFKSGNRKKVMKFVNSLDTDPRDWLLDKIEDMS